MRGRFSFQKEKGDVRLFRTNELITLTDSKTEKTFKLLRTSPELLLEREGKRYEVRVLYQKDRDAYVWVNGKVLQLQWASSENVAGSSEESARAVHAVMPGRVVKIHAKVGDIVEPETPLLVLEAMKMENEIKATGIGKITEIVVREGASVESGALLIRIDPMEEA